MSTGSRYLGVLLLASCVGCVSLPKPEELVALERLRGRASFREARASQRSLAEGCDEAHLQAVEAWEDKELALARYWASLGLIRARTIMTLAESGAAAERLLQLKQQLDDATKQKQQLGEQLRILEEMVQLYEELAVAQTNTRERDLHLSEVQQRTAALQKLGAAQLALKRAETVGAMTHAKSLYVMAQTLMEKASAALRDGKPADASAAGEMAKKKADAAYEAARPLFLKEREAAERHARNQALQQQASAIAASHRGVSVKLHTAAGMQQLVIPITFLFKPMAVRSHPKKRVILTKIGELLKRYKEYPVLINGYTSYRTPKKNRGTISKGRAQHVADHLTAMGVEAKRFVIEGRSADKLIGYRFNAINDRVEIILLFQ